jgi:hypothetical protein
MLEPTPTPILALELRPKEPPAVALDDWVEVGTLVWRTKTIEDTLIISGEEFVI